MSALPELRRRWADRVRRKLVLLWRPDLEHETSLNRLVFCSLIAVYLSVVPEPDRARAMLICAVYTLVAVGIVAALLLWPRKSHGRRILALFCDLAALTAEMHAGGGANAAFYPIYLWVIFGNGFRFGLSYLFLALGASVVSFGFVIATTPYWQAQPFLTGSLLLSLLILPGYAGSLIAKLSEAKRVAEAANQSKSRFLANVSHEVRTPLNAILGSTSLLRDAALQPEQDELVDALEVGTRTLLSLIGGILDFSRIEAGRMPVRLQPVDLPNLLADIHELLRPQAHLKGLHLRLHATPRVPETIQVDRRHLHEVLLNLVSNAIKFTLTGQVVVSVDATPGSDGTTQLRFEVADTGIGIAPEACEAIFESFTQAEPAIVDRFGGTGLGLSIARQLVELMGGRIAVQSTPGAGSVFWFTIATGTTEAPASLQDGATNPDAAAGIDRPAAIAFPRVVLLAGDPDLAARIERTLQSLDVPHERAVHDQDAVERVARRPLPGEPRRTVLLLQHDGLQPDARVGRGAEAMLARIDEVAVVAIADSLLPVGELPDLSFRRRVCTWVSTACDGPELRAALRKADGRTGRRQAQPFVAPVPPARRLHVLVADDNQTNLRVVAKVLERAGHSMRLVGNGVEALDALEQERFDIVLMDVNMPGMNGIEATKLYRFASLGRESVPIVALTADATPEMERACIEAGMTACLTKPIEVFRLAAMIERLAAPAAAVTEPSPAAPDREDSNVLPLRPARSRPALDREVLDNLRMLGGQEFLDEMIDSFTADAADLIESIAEAARIENLILFRNQVHALRSCASNVGAVAIQDTCSLCREIEPGGLRMQGGQFARRLVVELDRLERSRQADADPVTTVTTTIGAIATEHR